MNLARALRLSGPVRLALVGAGGKTSALFDLARRLPPPVWLSATTHLGLDQLELADRVIYLPSPEINETDLAGASQGVSLFMHGPAGEARTHGLNEATLAALKGHADRRGVPLLVEADGSRSLPLKAPAAHEPVIPAWVETVVVLAGLSGLGVSLTDASVHRPELFSALTGLPLGSRITAEALTRELLHPAGGLKNIPAAARKVTLLNQADTPELENTARQMVPDLLRVYDAVICAALRPGGGADGEPPARIARVDEPVAAVVLAGGASRRLARPKQLLEWRGEPLVRHVARAALQAGLDPVTVVTGATAEAVAAALAGLPVRLAHNPDWEAGQSTSIRAGVLDLPGRVGAALFLLSDQPQAPAALMSALIEVHAHSLSPLVAPTVHGRRANPVLFDRVTFPDLLTLRGDVGGRAIFDRYTLETLAWDDPRLLLDVDTEEDYARLLEME